MHSSVLELEERQGWGLAGEGPHLDLDLGWEFLIHLSKKKRRRRERERERKDLSIKSELFKASDLTAQIH